jgi:threonine/homoserine/homoserine lactone efflux protein
MWLTGSVILFWLGITGLRAKGPAMQKRMVKVIKNGEETHEPEIFFPRASIIDMVKSYAIGLALTLSSPPTIMFWLFNGLMVASTRLTGKAIENASVPYLLAAGVGTSCALWVTGAVTVVNRFHRNLRPETYVWVERIAGSALCCFGGYALIEAVRIMAKFKHWG